MAKPTTTRNVGEQAFVWLGRISTVKDRYPVVLLEQDIAELDQKTGSRRRSRFAIEELSRLGWLRPIRRGMYVLTGTTGVVDISLFELIDAATTNPYLITAGRALQYHGLSDQHFRRVVTLTTHRIRGWSWRGDEVHYVKVTRSRLWGSVERTIDGRRVRLARAERAILDSLAHPEWGVTLSQVAEALDVALRESAFNIRLAEAAARYGNAAVVRRLGFLTEYIAGEEAAQPLYPLRGASKAITLLQPSTAISGRVNTRWRLRENVDAEMLLQKREP